MPSFAPLFALVAALAARAPQQAAPVRIADLQARPVGPRVTEPAPARPRAPATAACVADVCQPIVSVPGFEPEFPRASRTELFADLLERSHVEPLASIVSALVASGVQVDYTPGFIAGAGGSGRARWGSLAVGLRLRLDPWNAPVLGWRPAQR